ncbi:hypothetical protein [Actinopolymorpha sp. B9G3]|uniref:hypothetical protein n=1 Tax=Actinopolymorpha sp. B9G3 TaxID=3158970 RepID=UPI0032D8ED1E
MTTYDFFVAGRWRNRNRVHEVLATVRANGYSAYCFIENTYSDEKITFGPDDDPAEFMRQSEALPQDDPLVRQIFETDVAREREASRFLLVLPAGAAGHIEAGIAFGLGKPCFAVGDLAKTETLYCIFDQIFPDTDALHRWLAAGQSH